MEIGTIGVVGAGQMGSGIAHVAAASGASVILADAAPEIVAAGRASIAKNLDREVAKGKRTPAERDAALALISTTADLGALAGADLVIEAVTENEEVKKAVFRRLDAALALGLAVCGAASLVPVAGPIVWSAASILAVGAALSTRFGSPRFRVVLPDIATS